MVLKVGMKICLVMALFFISIGIVSAPECLLTEISVVNGLSTNSVQMNGPSYVVKSNAHICFGLLNIEESCCNPESVTSVYISKDGFKPMCLDIKNSKFIDTDKNGKIDAIVVMCELPDCLKDGKYSVRIEGTCGFNDNNGVENENIASGLQTCYFDDCVPIKFR